VNSSPGLEGIEKASGVNVAGEIIDFVISEASFSEVDLDQLMRTVPGQGVLSLQIRNHPNLVGERLSDLFKTGEKVPVFALSRDNSLIWNPDSELQLRYTDILICYGELTELRSSLRQAIGENPNDFIVEGNQDSSISVE
jgi:ribosomal protein S6--L-glutamate ligase